MDFSYFQNFPYSPSGLPILPDIVYALIYLGAPVGYPHLELAAWIGYLSVVLLVGNVVVYWWRHKSLLSIAPWLQLAVFVLGCTQATEQGRLYWGIQQALSSRYEVFSSLWWTALLVIMSLNIKELWLARGFPRLQARKIRRSVLGVNLAAVLLTTVALVPVNVVGLQYGVLFQDVQRQNQDAIVSYRQAPLSCLNLYYPWTDLLRQRSQFLEQARLGVFYSSKLPKPATGRTMAACQKPYDFMAYASGTSKLGSPATEWIR